MISRREFLILTSAAAVGSGILLAADRVPTMLDHLLLGCSDFEQGIAFVERHTGVRPAIGGVHPGRGTRNALLSLGHLYYLEVIAPDPAQTGTPTTRAALLSTLRRLAAPVLVDWAVHSEDIAAIAERWRKAGVAFEGPTPGSRTRPDGKMLHWQTLNLANDRNGLLPFFIQWGADTVHPSVDAPEGCKLESFSAVSPDSSAVSAELQKLGIDAQVEAGNAPHLRARIVGPGGTMQLG